MPKEPLISCPACTFSISPLGNGMADMAAHQARAHGAPPPGNGAVPSSGPGLPDDPLLRNGKHPFFVVSILHSEVARAWAMLAQVHAILLTTPGPSGTDVAQSAADRGRQEIRARLEAEGEARSKELAQLLERLRRIENVFVHDDKDDKTQPLVRLT